MKLYRHQVFKKCPRAVLPALLAGLALGLAASCGPDNSERWDESLQLSAPIQMGADIVYLNSTMDQLHIVRPAMGEEGPELSSKRVPTGKRPRFMRPGADEQTLFVVNGGDDSLSVFDMSTGTPTRQDVALDSAYDSLAVDPEGEFLLLSFSGAGGSDIIARNLNELGIVDLRGNLPEKAEFVTLPSRARNIVFAPPFELGGHPQRLAASLSPSEITIIDLNTDNEMDRLRSIPLTISQADAIRNPTQAVFDVLPNESAPNTVSLYVLTDRGEDITQISIQPSVREDSLRKFDVSVNQLAAGQSPGKMAVLDLPGVGTRLLALDRERPRFTLVDVASGESATFSLPITSAATDMLVYRAQVIGEDRVETRVLAYSTRSSLVAVIRPETIAVSGDAPTVGSSVVAIRADKQIERIVMDKSSDQERAIAFHSGTRDGFTVLNLRTNKDIPIQGQSLADIKFDGSLGYGTFRGSNHFVRFDLDTGHPTVFDLPAEGSRIFVNSEPFVLLVEHADASGNHAGNFTVFDARSPIPDKARTYSNLFFDALFDQELP